MKNKKAGLLELIFWIVITVFAISAMLMKNYNKNNNEEDNSNAYSVYGTVSEQRLN